MKQYLFFVFFAGLFTSCAKELDHSPNINQEGTLAIETSIGNSTTRASVSNSFAENDVIGVALYNTVTDEPYDGMEEAINRSFLFKDGRWQTDKEIALNEQMGVAYAYYPYSSQVMNIDSIPISLNQTDYLWGVSSQKNLSTDKVEGTMTANITMDHLLSRVMVKLYKSFYPDAVVSRIKVRSKTNKAILSTESKGITFSARNGTISGLKPKTNSEIDLLHRDSEQEPSIPLPEEVPADPTASAVILPTASFETGDLEFVITVNNKEYTTPIPAPVSSEYNEASGGWNQRFSYTYAIEFTGAALNVSGISLIPWIMLPHQELDIEINNPYTHTADYLFYWYKKQENTRVLQSEETELSFIVYANKELNTTDLTAKYPKENVVKNISVLKKDISSNDYVDGERTLGKWRYEMKITLTPNPDSSLERRDTIQINYKDAPFAGIPLIQRKP